MQQHRGNTERGRRILAGILVAVLVAVVAPSTQAGASSAPTVTECVQGAGGSNPIPGMKATISARNVADFFAPDTCAAVLMAEAQRLGPFVDAFARAHGRTLAPGELWGNVTVRTGLPERTQLNSFAILRAIDLSTWVEARRQQEERATGKPLRAYFTCVGADYVTGIPFMATVVTSRTEYTVRVEWNYVLNPIGVDTCF